VSSPVAVFDFVDLAAPPFLPMVDLPPSSSSLSERARDFLESNFLPPTPWPRPGLEVASAPALCCFEAFFPSNCLRSASVAAVAPRDCTSLLQASGGATYPTPWLQILSLISSTTTQHSQVSSQIQEFVSFFTVVSGFVIVVANKATKKVPRYQVGCCLDFCIAQSDFVAYYIIFQ
jgi:hypothetical protein